MTTLTRKPLATASRTLRVLVVEDEPRWRDFLVEVIPDIGFPARGVGSAEQALEVMAHDPHDILILDLHLPTITGIELFERVRERWPTTQGIILTAYGELSAAQAAIRLRVVEFLTKPCHLFEIENALERARRLCLSARAEQRIVPLPMTPPDAVTLEETERQRITDALARHHNNKSAVARELGISRRSLYDRLTRRPPESDGHQGTGPRGT